MRREKGCQIEDRDEKRGESYLRTQRRNNDNNNSDINICARRAHGKLAALCKMQGRMQFIPNEECTGNFKLYYERRRNGKRELRNFHFYRYYLLVFRIDLNFQMFINRNSCREERLDNESITFETIFFYELSLIFTYLFTSPISDTIPIKFANQSEKII